MERQGCERGSRSSDMGLAAILKQSYVCIINRVRHCSCNLLTGSVYGLFDLIPSPLNAFSSYDPLNLYQIPGRSPGDAGCGFPTKQGLRRTMP